MSRERPAKRAPKGGRGKDARTRRAGPSKARERGGGRAHGARTTGERIRHLPPRVAEAVLLAVPVLIYAVLWLLLLDPRPSPAGDNVLYLLLARSLAEGRGLSEIHLPQALPHTKYAFAFPAFLAPVWALSDGSLQALKALIGVTGAAAVVLTQLLLRRRGRAIGFAAALALALSPLFLELAGDTFSEVPFLAVTLLSLLLFETSQHGGRRSVRLFLALACATAGIWIRLVGVALPAAYAVTLWRTGRRRAAAGAGLALAAGLAVWVPSFRSGGGYVAELAARYEMAETADSAAWTRGASPGRTGAFPATATTSGEGPNSVLEALGARLGENLTFLFVYGPLGQSLTPWTRSGLDFVPILCTLLALVVIGAFCWGRLRRTPEDPVPAYVLITIAVLLVWSAPIERFFLPLSPLIVMAALTLARGAGNRALIVTAILLCGSQLVGAAARVAEAVTVREDLARGNEAAGLPGPYAQFRRAALWARTLPPGTVLAARKPQVAFYYSGLPSVAYPLTSDSREFAAELVRLGADYLVVDQEGRGFLRYVASFYRAYAAKLPRAFETGEPFNTVVVNLTPLRQPAGLEPAGRPSTWPPVTRFPMRAPRSSSR